MESLTQSEINTPDLYFPKGFDQITKNSEEPNLQAPKIPEVEGKNRGEALEQFRDYFVEIANLSDDVPVKRHKALSGDKKISKERDSLLIGLHMLVISLASPKKRLDFK